MAVSSLVARSLFRSAIPKLFTAGYSANRAFDYMKNVVGAGYRRQVYLADWREMTGVEKIKESFRYIPKKYRLSFGLTVPRAGRMSTNYQYLFEISGIDPQTGKPSHVYVSMLDDVRMEPELAENLMREQIEDREKYPEPYTDYKEYDLQLYVVYRNRDIVFRR